jgi:ATP-dependent DNA helicase RecQ
MQTAVQVLEKYFGYNSFRPLQQEIIDAVVQKKDVLALLPTGGGKSICFQVPALMQDGICLVVSPLIALIKDQVENLKKKDITALALHTGMHILDIKRTLENAAHGNYKFLYVSPERLQSKLFLEYLPAIQPNLIVVDEAHCISQWGYDFRPSYLTIASLKEELPHTPIIALTASATPQVQQDICDRLLFSKNAAIFKQSFVRHNLSYSSFNVASKEVKLLQAITSVQGTSIVYCKSRKQTIKTAMLLQQHGINADFYHAGLPAAERNSKQQKWISNELACIVCTNAFGMGIDKPNVRLVVHYDMPDCLENYYQEAGRAGRDGNRAYAVLLYNDNDVTDLQNSISIKYPTKEYLKQLYIDVMDYLQVPAGIGEGQTIEFDILTFSANFTYNNLAALNGIKTLAQEGFFSFTDSFYQPSTIQFICSKDDIAAFEQMQPWSSEIIKGLLRMYEGIFDYPVSINEKAFCKFVQRPLDLVQNYLSQLHQYKIINYKPTTEKPQIFLLLNRMYADSIVINSSNIEARKQLAITRVKAMAEYVNYSNCRNNYISNYFGDNAKNDCGVCDNCLKKIAEAGAAKQKAEILATILSLLNSNNLKFEEIASKFPPAKNSTVKQVLTQLRAEEKLIITENGLISLKKQA